jgi:hypothetical protein
LGEICAGAWETSELPEELVESRCVIANLPSKHLTSFQIMTLSITYINQQFGLRDHSGNKPRKRPLPFLHPPSCQTGDLSIRQLFARCFGDPMRPTTSKDSTTSSMRQAKKKLNVVIIYNSLSRVMFWSKNFFANKQKHPHIILTSREAKVKAQYAGGVLVFVYNL